MRYADQVRLGILTAYNFVNPPWMKPPLPEPPEHRACRQRTDEEREALDDGKG